MQTATPQSGFTLIEMLVSLSLFTVVVTITVGSMLVLINGNRELVNSQSIMDSLSFSMDSMTREIRTGRAYFCGSVNNTNANIGGSGTRIFNDSSTDHDNLGRQTRDCVNGNQSGHRFHGVSVIEGGNSVTGSGSTRILYYYRAGSGSTPGTIMRRVGNGMAESIFSSGLEVTSAEFFVSDSASLDDGNNRQPTVTVVLTAADINDPSDTMTLQTTITQRELDI